MDLFKSILHAQGQEARNKAAPPAAIYEAILEREERAGIDAEGDPPGGEMDLVAAALAGLPEGDEASQLAALAAAGGASLEARTSLMSV